jgi:hypothetical protein
MELVIADFFYAGGYCRSDGCSEYFFNYRIRFSDEYGAKALIRAKQTVERALINDSAHMNHEFSVFQSESRLSMFINNMRKTHPEARKEIALYSCKHWNILFEQAVRFDNIDKCQVGDLEQEIRKHIPEDNQPLIRVPITERIYLL